MKNNISLLKQAVSDSKNILILTHASPDGDALGSASSLKLILGALGKEADCFLDEPCPNRFPHLKQYFQIQPVTNTVYDLVILVDCADRTRPGVQYPAPHKIAGIDHHISNPRDLDINIVDAAAAATAEMIFTILKEWEIPCNQEIAAAIYTGILTDTGGFLYQNTTEKTHRIAAELLCYPFDKNQIARVSFLEKTLTYSLLYAHLFRTLTHYEAKHAVIGFIDYEIYHNLHATPEDTEGLSAVLRNITGIECGVLLTEREKGLMKGSIRTNDRYDANALAGLFGGGGHVRAAGFQTRQTFDEIKEKIYEWLSLA